jgi:hypothetical protein
VQIYNAGVRVRLSQPTPALQAAEVENIKTSVDVTDRLGASHMRVFGGNRTPEGASEDQVIAWAAEVLKRGTEYAGNRGIALGVERDAGFTTKQVLKLLGITSIGDRYQKVEYGLDLTLNVKSRVGSVSPKITSQTNAYSQLEVLVPYTTRVHLQTLGSTADGKSARRRGWSIPWCRTSRECPG